MKKWLKKTARFMLRFVLSVAALVIALIILINIILVVGFVFLNSTGKARDLIQAQVNKALSESGYTVEIGSLFYEPVRGFNVYNITLQDDNGTLFSAERLWLRPSYDRLLVRQLDVALTGRDFILYRLPEKKQEDLERTGKFKLHPFELPDIYFNRISLSKFEIKNIELRPEIAGEKILLSPSGQFSVGLTDVLKGDIVFSPGFTSPPAWPVPEGLKLNFSLDTQSLDFNLDDFSLKAKNYDVSAKGVGRLQAGGALDFEINASSGDFANFTGGAFQSATLNGSLKGVFDHPAVNLQGQLVPGTLKEQELGNVDIVLLPDLEAENPSAHLNVKSIYKDQPADINADLSYEAPLLRVSKLQGSAPYVAIGGDVDLNIDAMLAEGKIKISLENFEHYAGLLQQDIEGSISGDVTFAVVNDVQSVSGEFKSKKIRYQDMTFSGLSASGDVPDISYPWPARLNVKLDSAVLTPDISLRASSVVLQKGQKQETYGLSLDVKGHMQKDFSLKGNADVGGIGANLPDLNNIKISLTSGRSRVNLAGTIAEEKVDLQVDIAQMNLQDLPVDLPDAFSKVSADGDVKMQGLLSAPSTQANMRFSGFNTGSYKNLSLDLQAKHEDKAASLNLSGKGKGIRALDVKAEMPLQFSLYPFNFSINRGSPVSGNLNADIDLTPFSTLFLPATQELVGQVKANGSIGGSLSAPDVKGEWSLSGGRFEDGPNGIYIDAMKADGTFSPAFVTIRSFTATDGENGSLQGNGRIGFAQGQETGFSVKAQQMHIPREGMADGIVSADLALKGVAEGYSLGGKVSIEEMNITIPEHFQSNIPELNIVDPGRKETGKKAASSIALDIGINAPNQVFVRGWGLDAEFGGEIQINGDASDPQFNGALSARRGRYEEFGKRFDLERANLRFQGSIPPSPYLDIEAVTKTSDITASVLLTGPVKAPKIGFSSVPSLPEDEVLSHILFGRDASKISPFQAVQLAQALRRFSGQGGGGFDPLGTLRSLTGVDDISVETDAAGETSVGVGKYLTEKVYLEFERGKAENSGAATLQIEVTPSINIESEIGQDARTGAGVFWKRDY